MKWAYFLLCYSECLSSDLCQQLDVNVSLKVLYQSSCNTDHYFHVAPLFLVCCCFAHIAACLSANIYSAHTDTAVWETWGPFVAFSFPFSQMVQMKLVFVFVCLCFLWLWQWAVSHCLSRFCHLGASGSLIGLWSGPMPNQRLSN